MGNNQFCLFGNRLGNALRRNGQAGHDSLHLAARVTNEQADIVPVGGQPPGSKVFQISCNGRNSKHGSCENAPTRHNLQAACVTPRKWSMKSRLPL